MTEQSRNRLLGAVILVSLAALLLPMLFDGAGIERRAVPQMPEQGDPDHSVADGDAPDDADWAFLEDVAQRRETSAPIGRPQHVEESEETAAAFGDSGPGLDAEGLPRAWSVQLAAFREVDNARALRQQLLEDGFDAYLIEDAHSGLQRLAVGPRIDRAAAERLREELAARYEMEGLVVRFGIGRAAELPDRQAAERD